MHEHIVSFLCLLCERGRAREVFDSIKEFQNLLSFSKNVSKAYVKSAFPLNEDEKDRISKKLEKLAGGPVILECSVDEGLIGGVVIEMNGKVIDGSINNRLQKMKDVIKR